MVETPKKNSCKNLQNFSIFIDKDINLVYTTWSFSQQVFNHDINDFIYQQDVYIVSAGLWMNCIPIVSDNKVTNTYKIPMQRYLHKDEEKHDLVDVPKFTVSGSLWLGYEI